MGPVIDRRAELNGYAVGFVSFGATPTSTGRFRQCPAARASVRTSPTKELADLERAIAEWTDLRVRNGAKSKRLERAVSSA
jgi:hypothetical protein